MESPKIAQLEIFQKNLTAKIRAYADYYGKREHYKGEAELMTRAGGYEYFWKIMDANPRNARGSAERYNPEEAYQYYEGETAKLRAEIIDDLVSAYKEKFPQVSLSRVVFEAFVDGCASIGSNPTYVAIEFIDEVARKLAGGGQQQTVAAPLEGDPTTQKAVTAVLAAEPSLDEQTRNFELELIHKKARLIAYNIKKQNDTRAVADALAGSGPSLERMERLGPAAFTSDVNNDWDAQDTAIYRRAFDMIVNHAQVITTISDEILSGIEHFPEGSSARQRYSKLLQIARDTINKINRAAKGTEIGRSGYPCEDKYERMKKILSENISALIQAIEELGIAEVKK